jgi:hypothetical protein
MICDSSNNWSLDKSDIDKLETAVYKLLSDKAAAVDSDFDMSKFLGYLYNKALEGYGDSDKALTLLRAVPQTMKLVVTAFDDLSSQLMSKKVPLNINTLYKLANDFNADLNNVREYVNTNLVKSNVIASQRANEDAKKEQTPPKSDVKVLGEFQALPANPFTSSGNELQSDEMIWYYDFLKSLDKRMMDLGGPDKDGGIDFNGRKIYVSMMFGSNIPTNQLYPTTQASDALVKGSANAMHLVFTDVSGNPLYFSDTYDNATSEDGKIIYFPQRAIPNSKVDSNGNLVFELESAEGRTLQSIEYAARVEGTTKDAIIFRYNSAFARLKEIQSYLSKNPNSSVKLDIENISRGFMNLQSSEQTRIADVKNITAFSPVITGNRKLINVPGVQQPVEFFMAPYTEEMASKVADLLLNEVIYNSKVMTPTNKFNLIADFTMFGTTADSFRYDKETGTIFLGKDAVDTTDKQAAKNQIVAFLTREFTNTTMKNAKGEFVKQKNQFFYNNKKATGNFIDFTLSTNSAGSFNMNISTRPYLDWVKENALVSVGLFNGEIRQVNGYVQFSVGTDAMRTLATQSVNQVVNKTSDEIYSKLNPTKTITGNIKKVGWKAVLAKASEVYPTTTDGNFQIVATRIPGTNQHFGNPFSSTESVLKKNKDLIPVSDTVEAVKSYIDWVTNTNFDYSNSGKSQEEIELLKERAHWIRKEMMSGRLQGKDILYYVELKEPAHSNALDYLINNFNWGAFEFEKTKQGQKKPVEEVVPSNVPTNSEIVVNKSKDFDFGAYKRRGQGEINATPSQIAEAASWYNNLKIKFKDPSGKIVEKNITDVIPYHVMFRIANSNGDVRARWTRSGISLYQGSDYSDLYHEAWHGFTQWFLTANEKLSLYDAVKNSGDEIKYYDDSTNSWKSMSSSDLDFSIKNHKLYAEEHLAEKFREFALNGGKFPKEEPLKVKSIFKRIWNALKALFGFTSKDSTLTPVSYTHLTLPTNVP